MLLTPRPHFLGPHQPTSYRFTDQGEELSDKLINTHHIMSTAARVAQAGAASTAPTTLAFPATLAGNMDDDSMPADLALCDNCGRTTATVEVRRTANRSLKARTLRGALKSCPLLRLTLFLRPSLCLHSLSVTPWWLPGAQCLDCDEKQCDVCSGFCHQAVRKQAHKRRALGTTCV
jgi:hypothetical protein